MLYAIIGSDSEHSLQKRLAVRPQHLERLQALQNDGRLLLAELLIPNDPAVGRAILDRIDATELHALAMKAGMNSISQRVQEAVAAGRTSPAEARRVLGFRDTTM